MNQFIKGLKILDVSTVLAGPSVGMFFAEMGAEVTKLEHPTNKDVTRSWRLPSESKDGEVSAYFSSVNYRKTYSSINFKNFDDVNGFKEKIKETDILIINFKKGDQEKFDITDSTLLKLNPQLIIGKINGFGAESDRVAYDLILQAETGFMSMNGTPNSGPVKMPVALIDVLAGHQLKEGILSALLNKTLTNKGSIVEVSLYESAICSLVNQASNYLMEKHIPQRIGSLHPNIAPYGELFNTKDSATITFAIGSNTHFKKLCTFLDLTNLIGSEKFGSNQERIKNRVELFNLLDAKIKNIDANDILNWCEKNFVPAGKVKTLNEVFETQLAKQLVKEEQIENRLTKRVSSIAFNTKDGN